MAELADAQQRKREWLVRAVILTPAVILLAVGLVLAARQPASAPSVPWTPIPATAAPRVHRVTYEVLADVGRLTTGDTGGAATITYRNAGGDTAQEANRASPWRQSFTMQPGAFLYVAAQNYNDSGYILCRIYIDGRPVKETRSVGGYVIATCSWRLE